MRAFHGRCIIAHSGLYKAIDYGLINDQVIKSKPYHIITMRLVYSALRPVDDTEADQSIDKYETQIRHRAYLNACNKHEHIIKEIQRHFPNWMPPFK